MNNSINPTNIINKENSSSPVYTIPSETPNGGRGYLFCRRAIDIAFSIFVGLFLLIPMLIIALLIRIDSKGPVLFRQERLGKDGKPFMICKFRTMTQDAEKDGPRWASRNDDRCTKLGRVLRRARLDEIPQLWNILKGEMTLVGPRPERPCFYEEFETYIHGFHNRLVVRPGLTGLAQVSGGYDLAPEEKIIFDMEYIRTRTIWLDIKLIFKTIKLIFTREGAR